MTRTRSESVMDEDYVEGSRKTYQKGNKKANGNKTQAAPPLKLLNYRNFIKTIGIYHYPHTLQSLSDFENFLRKEIPHYAGRRMLSKDNLRYNFVPEGDEVPDGKLEVGYLPAVFSHGGDALGFRFQAEDRIVWFCFRRSIDTFLEEAHLDGEPVFDLVATLERGGTGKKGNMKGNKEHRDWHAALEESWDPPVSLRLTWQNRDRDRMLDLEERKMEGELITEDEMHAGMLTPIVEKPDAESEEECEEEFEEELEEELEGDLEEEFEEEAKVAYVDDNGNVAYYYVPESSEKRESTPFY